MYLWLYWRCYVEVDNGNAKNVFITGDINCTSAVTAIFHPATGGQTSLKNVTVTFKMLFQMRVQKDVAVNIINKTCLMMFWTNKFRNTVFSATDSLFKCLSNRTLSFKNGCVKEVKETSLLVGKSKTEIMRFFQDLNL